MEEQDQHQEVVVEQWPVVEEQDQHQEVKEEILVDIWVIVNPLLYLMVNHVMEIVFVVHVIVEQVFVMVGPNFVVKEEMEAPPVEYQDQTPHHVVVYVNMMNIVVLVVFVELTDVEDVIPVKGVVGVKVKDHPRSNSTLAKEVEELKHKEEVDKWLVEVV